MTYRQWLIVQQAMCYYANANPDTRPWDEKGDGPQPTNDEVSEAMAELTDIVTVLAPEERQ